MKEEQIKKAYELAKARYAEFGIDTDKAIETLERTPISLHCWQADDVVGFERNEGLSSKMDMDVFSAADMSALIGIMRDAQNNESHQRLLAKAGRPFGLSVASVKEIDLDGGPLHYITGTAGTIGVYSIPGTTEAVMVIMIGSAFDSASAVSFLATLAVQ